MDGQHNIPPLQCTFHGAAHTMRKSKIFGIGLAKTGTTSLNDAFAMLGITSIGCPATISSIRRFEAATDGIVADRFEQLDRTFPGSKFIYTVREREDWVNSYIRHQKRKRPSLPGHEEMAKRLYLTTGTDRDLLLEAYDRHQHRVLDYFSERPGDLLVLDICGGHADWEALCGFLGERIPDEPFPSSNTGFSNNILLHLLCHMDDLNEVSGITRTPVDYLRSLSTEHYDPSGLIHEEPSKRSDRIMVKVCKHFGGVSKAAKRLQLDEHFLNDAIDRHRRRKKARPRRKSTYMDRVIDNMKRLSGKHKG